ncbi:MAG: L,D-transpeptidase family protein [Acidobacteriota bacterium]
MRAALLAALAAASGCGRPPAVPPVELVRTALRARVGPPGTAGPVSCRRDMICGSEALPDFYRKRGLRPAWIDEGLALADARAFVAALRRVAEDGLDPANYHLAALESLIAETDAARKKGLRSVRPETLADLEMLLTDGFLLCGSHLAGGQVDPETLHSEWSVKRDAAADLAAVLEKGLAAGDVPAALDSLRPGNVIYLGIRKAYAICGALVAAGGWPAFPPGPKLARGDRDARIAALRRSLAIRGDLAGAGDAGGGDLFDGALEAGLKAFQARHGLEPDGVVGAATATALDVSAPDRLRQIRANLERWRWISRDLGERYVLVNVAGYRLGVFAGGRLELSMPAIVGRAYRQTPDFSGRIATVTINPAWNVPPKLAREDILPKVRQDPGYLRKKAIRVFAGWSEGAREIDPAAVDWTSVTPESLSYKFRQDPGPQNALGRILFLFPNKFDVYIHDTPERWLFSLPVRDFSSGCIRIEKPVDLAAHLLRGDPAWTRDRIAAAIAAGETKVIALRPTVPVHVLYWTTWLDADGRVQLRPDIYLRDAALVRALEERAPRPAR